MVGKGYQNLRIFLGAYSASSLVTLYLLLRDLRPCIHAWPARGRTEDNLRELEAGGYELLGTHQVLRVETDVSHSTSTLSSREGRMEQLRELPMSNSYVPPFSTWQVSR